MFDARFVRSKAPLFVAALVALVLTTLSSAAFAIVNPCTQGGLDAALKNGGVETFSCTVPTTIKLSAVEVIANNVTLDGGGLLTISGNDAVVPIQVNAGVTATLQNITIEHGMSGGYGGNVYNSGSLTIAKSIIQNGSNGFGGTIYVDTGATLTLDSSSVINNKDGPEGTVAVHGTATLINSTISGNTGRGVTTRGGSATVTYSTIVTGDEDLFLFVAGDTVTTGHSLLVAGNGVPSSDTLGGGVVISQGYNMLSMAGIKMTGTTTGDQIGVSPTLGPLQINVGPTPTQLLLACSPGINAGATTGGPAFDQQGNARNMKGAIDIGACESSFLPCISVADVSVSEGNTGTTPMSFSVQLSGVSTLAVGVSWAIADGTATVADNDYTASATTGALSFTSGTTTLPISVVQVVGDTTYEADETLALTLSAPTNGTISDGAATGTILNDDSLPAISVSDLSAAEGVGNASVTVSLSNPSYQTITVAYATADGTATAGSDYTAASSTLTFTPGVTTQMITIPITQDAIAEGDETFTVNLTGPTNATILDGSGTVTIIDDDGTPGIQIGSLSTPEGNAGPTVVNLPVTLNPASSQTVSVDWATVDGTATVADDDYTAATGTVTFAPGETSKNIQVTINGDLQVEPDEAFTVHLSNPSGATIALADGTITITNDDTAPPPDAGAASDDAGTTTNDDGGSSGGSDGGGSASSPDAGGVGLGGPPVTIGSSGAPASSGSSSDGGSDCSVAFVGAEMGARDAALVGAPLALLVMVLRRRRRKS